MNREQIIEGLVKGKSVLDVGSTDQEGTHLLWKRIKAVAGSVQGIDIRPSSDPDVVQGNMETYTFSRQFDFVVMGDIIEHASNQGMLLDNVYRCLNASGKLILTTPNAKWWTVVFRPNTEHVMWHDRYTLKYLLETHGFIIERLQFYPGNAERLSLLARILRLRQAILMVCAKGGAPVGLDA